MNSIYFDIFLIIGAIHGFLFNVVTLVYTSRKKITKPVLYLNVVVLSISLNNLQAGMVSRGITFSQFFLQHLEMPWYLFSVPFFYCFLVLFLRVKDESTRILKNILYVFGIEILARLGVISYCYITQHTTELIEDFRQIEESVNAAISLFYMYKAYQIVFRRKEEYAFVLSFDALVWLRHFMRLGAAVILLWILTIVLNFHYDSITMYYPLRIGTTVLIYWIGYQGLIRYTVLKDRIQLRNKIRQNPITPRADTQLQTVQHTTLQTIENRIVGEQLFLNPQLSIQDVATALDISVSKLSKRISTHSQQHFTDLVNTYRVEHAIKLLQDKDFDAYTIDAIGLESGFNSKSAFYNAFKKTTAQTPSAYRNSANT